VKKNVSAVLLWIIYIYIIIVLNFVWTGGLAQLVGRRTTNPKTPGSILDGRMFFFLRFFNGNFIFPLFFGKTVKERSKYIM